MSALDDAIGTSRHRENALPEDDPQGAPEAGTQQRAGITPARKKRKGPIRYLKEKYRLVRHLRNPTLRELYKIAPSSKISLAEEYFNGMGAALVVSYVSMHLYPSLGLEEQTDKTFGPLLIFADFAGENLGALPGERFARKTIDDHIAIHTPEERANRLFLGCEQLLTESSNQPKHNDIEDSLRKYFRSLENEEKLLTTSPRPRWGSFIRKFMSILRQGCYEEEEATSGIDWKEAGAVLGAWQNKALQADDSPRLEIIVRDYLAFERTYLFHQDKYIARLREQSGQPAHQGDLEMELATATLQATATLHKTSAEHRISRANKVLELIRANNIPPLTEDHLDLLGHLRDHVSAQMEGKEIKKVYRSTEEALGDLEKFRRECIRATRKEDLQKIAAASFRAINKSIVEDFASYASLFFMYALSLSQSPYLKGKGQLALLIGARGLIDGTFDTARSRITEYLQLNLVRKQLTASNLDPDKAYEDFQSVSSMAYNLGYTIGAAMGITCTSFHNESRKWPLLLLPPIAFASIIAAYACHYWWRNKVKKELKGS